MQYLLTIIRYISKREKKISLFCFGEIFKYLYIVVINLRNWNSQRYNEYTRPGFASRYDVYISEKKLLQSFPPFTNWPTSEIEQNLEAKIKIAWIL